MKCLWFTMLKTLISFAFFTFDNDEFCTRSENEFWMIRETEN